MSFSQIERKTDHGGCFCFACAYNRTQKKVKLEDVSILTGCCRKFKLFHEASNLQKIFAVNCSCEIQFLHKPRWNTGFRFTVSSASKWIAKKTNTKLIFVQRLFTFTTIYTFTYTCTHRVFCLHSRLVLVLVPRQHIHKKKEESFKTLCHH